MIQVGIIKLSCWRYCCNRRGIEYTSVVLNCWCRARAVRVLTQLSSTHRYQHLLISSAAFAKRVSVSPLELDTFTKGCGSGRTWKIATDPLLKLKNPWFDSASCFLGQKQLVRQKEWGHWVIRVRGTGINKNVYEINVLLTILTRFHLFVHCSKFMRMQQYENNICISLYFSFHFASCFSIVYLGPGTAFYIMYHQLMFCNTNEIQRYSFAINKCVLFLAESTYF